MGKTPAQRQKERRRATRLEAAREAERRRSRKKRLIGVVLLVGVVAMGLATVIGSLVSSSDDEATTTTTSPPTTVDPSSMTIGTPAELSAPPPGAAITGETPCPAEDGSSPRTTSFERPPPMCVDEAGRYQAVIRTSVGDLTALIYPVDAPQAANNFIVLARYHFFDGAPFHIIWPSGIAVTGDATGDPTLGEGGPGYTIPNEVPEVGAIYPYGTLAMWHRPGTGPTDDTAALVPPLDTMGGPTADGSQFLIATGENSIALGPEFTVFGLVTEGIDTINAINAFGDPANARPLGEVTIESIEITELEPT